MDDGGSLERVLAAAQRQSEPTRSQALVHSVADALEAWTPSECAGQLEAAEAARGSLRAVTRADTTLGGLLLKTLAASQRSAAPLGQAELRGRLLRLLAFVMPPLHASALNRDGLVASASFAVAARLPEDSVLESMDGATALRLDFQLYGCFWRLQQAISSGAAVLGRAALFDSMMAACESVVGAIQICLDSAKGSVAKLGSDGGDDDTDSGREDEERPLSYFRDPEVLLAHFSPEFDRRGIFKAQVLTQLAFYLAFLERTSKAERQTATLAEMKKRILGMLKSFPLGKVVGHLVLDDAKWQAWRVEVSAKSDPLPAPVDLFSDLPSSSGSSLSSGKRGRGMGDPELTRLWEASSAAEVVAEPTFFEFVDRVLEEADPENDIELQYQARNKPAFQWRMMRAGLNHLGKLVHGALFKADVLNMAQAMRAPSPGSSVAAEREALESLPSADGAPVDEEEAKPKDPKGNQEDDEDEYGEAALDKVDEEEKPVAKRPRDEEEVKDNGDGDGANGEGDEEEEEEEEKGSNKRQAVSEQ